MKKKPIHNLFMFIAIAGNGIYVLWILVNGIDEGFKGTMVQMASFIGLLFLLTLNTILLLRNGKPNN
jgi:hypothetical protein